MITDDKPSPVIAMSDFSANYLDRTLSSLSKVAQSMELDKYAKEMGMGDAITKMNKDRVKVLLSTFALIMILKSVKKHIVKIALFGGAGYMALKHKDMLQTLFNKEKYIASKFPVGDYGAELPTIVVDNDTKMIDEPLTAEVKLV